jgi:hypothetical protein
MYAAARPTQNRSVRWRTPEPFGTISNLAKASPHPKSVAEIIPLM